MTTGPEDRPAPTGDVARRLRPVQVGAALQGLMLWVPVEKLFATQIGFNAGAIALMAAAYAAVVPLLEVPSGILADRWSRRGILRISSVAAAASALLGGLSHSVTTYVIAAMVLAVYFALNSGTLDSVVYDTVVEETGSPELYEHWIGRLRIVESAAFAGSALAGGLLAQLTSPRATYFATVPLVLASVVVFGRFREPQLHRATEPVKLGHHVALTVRTMTRNARVRHAMLLVALTAMLSQAVFEFGPLWLVALHVRAAAYGPYWAILVGSGGVAGFLATRSQVNQRAAHRVIVVALVLAPVLLTVSHSVVAVAGSQFVVVLSLAVIGIRAGRILHDAVGSEIRAGVSSGAGTLSWMLFLPFSLLFGAMARNLGVAGAAWLIVAGCVAVAGLFLASTRVADTGPSCNRTEREAMMVR
jgi:MFS family permease